MRSAPALTLYLLAAFGLVACQRPGAPAVASTPAALRSAVEGVEWTLVSLDGKPAELGAGAKPATLHLASGERRATGFAGCNRIAGSYQLGARTLRFSSLFGTKMACVTGMELEQRYTEALEATREYRLAERMLELVGEQGVLARFESR